MPAAISAYDLDGIEVNKSPQAAMQHVEDGKTLAEPNLLGVGLMVIGCLSFGILLGWLRLRSGNVWPAVLGHGAFNAAAGFSYLVSTPDLQPIAASPLSWPGWLACAAVILLLLALGQFKNSRLPQSGA